MKWILYVTLLLLAVAGIFLLFVPAAGWVERTFGLGDAPGDILTGVGALFSALAFGLLIVTVLLQAHELSLQREELSSTRDVFQNQQFESTFFSLVTLHNEIVRSLTFVPPAPRHMTAAGEVANPLLVPVRLEGREVLASVLMQYRQAFARVRGEIPEMSIAEVSAEAYNRTFAEHRDLLGHYFRNLYHIVKFVDRSHVPTKKRYTSFVRAQLSGTELQLLFLNCNSEWGTKFRPLVEAYLLLEHLPLGEAIHTPLLLTYPKQSFGDNVALRHHWEAAARAADGLESGRDLGAE